MKRPEIYPFRAYCPGCGKRILESRPMRRMKYRCRKCKRRNLAFVPTSTQKTMIAIGATYIGKRAGHDAPVVGGRQYGGYWAVHATSFRSPDFKAVCDAICSDLVRTKRIVGTVGGFRPLVNVTSMLGRNRKASIGWKVSGP